MGCGIDVIISEVVIDNSKEGNNEPFQKKKLIGKGHLSAVFMAKSKLTGNEYALKELLANNPNLESIEEEADKLRNLDHPNIITFKSAFMRDTVNKELLIIITELGENGDLNQLLSKNLKKKIFFEEKQLLDWLIQCCFALLYIHEKQIVHGNIKPSNILLTKNNTIKLGDIGIFRKIINLEYNNIYFPPEFVEKEEYSSKSDIWSLGAVFYHLMALELPSVEKKEYNNEKILKNYSKEFADLIDDMTSVDPIARPKAEEILRKNIMIKRMNEYLKENNFDEKKNNEAVASIQEFLENVKKRRLKKIESKIIIDDEYKDKNKEENYEEKEERKNIDLLRQMSLIFDMTSKNVKK